jgi:hypothetical protein
MYLGFPLITVARAPYLCVRVHLVAQLPFLEQLRAHGNEAEVRRRLAQGQYHSSQVPVAEEWLREIEAKRADAASSRKEAREEESLFISRRALRNSILATIIATIVIIVAAREIIWSAIMSLFSK